MKNFSKTAISLIFVFLLLVQVSDAGGSGAKAGSRSGSCELSHRSHASDDHDNNDSNQKSGHSGSGNGGNSGGHSGHDSDGHDHSHHDHGSDDPTCSMSKITVSQTTTSGGCSMAGGSHLFISGTGFSSSDAHNNAITFNYNGITCTILDLFSSQNQLVCSTSQYNVEVTVTVGITVTSKKSKKCTCTGSNCGVNYQWASTPTIEALWPSAGNQLQEIMFYGIQRITNEAYVDYFKIGDELCEFYYKLEDNTATIPSDTPYYLPCDVPESPPGLYDVSQRNNPVGNSLKLNNVPIYHHIKNKVYDFAIIPKILYINAATGTAQGSPCGSRITIVGKGFSDTNGNVVKFGGYSCAIVSQTATKIICDLPPTPTAVPVNRGFHSGFRLEMFLNQQNIATVKNAANPTPAWTNSRLDGETPMNLGDNFVVRYRGYFQAPRTGNYKFLISGDNTMELWISPDTSAANLVKKAWITTPSGYKFYWDKNNANQISAPIAMTAGQEYYMEAYLSEASGLDYSTIGVMVPGLNSVVNQFYEVKSLQVTCPTSLEKIKYTVKAACGIVRLFLTFANGNTPVYKTTSDIPWDATPAVVQAAWTALGYSTIVTKAPVVSGSNTFYEYTIEFQTRTLSIQPVGIICPSPNKCSSVTTLVQPSAPVSGQFKVTHGTKSKFILYNDADSVVAEKLRQIDYTPLVRVQRYGDPLEGAEWRVAFVGDQGTNMGNLIIDASQLAGCANGAVSLTQTTLQDGGSTDLFYEVIPYQLIKTVHTKPQITVESDGILANCPKFNCDFNIVSTGNPVVTAESWTSSTKTLTVTITGANSFTKPQITLVTIAGVTCTVQTWVVGTGSNPATLTATCLNPHLGDYTVSVTFAGTVPGFACIDPAVVPIHFGPTITDVSDIPINPNGGDPITITGDGFPCDMQSAIDQFFEVYVGGEICDLISITCTVIVCESPPIDDDDTIVTIQNNHQPSTPPHPGPPVAPTNPTITNVDKVYLNPVLQVDLTITGTNFDGDVNTDTVVLVNQVTSDELECLVKTSTSTQIVCTFFGGPSAVYDLKAVTSHGNTNVVPVHIQVEISSVSPIKGSLAGGTLVTVNGQVYSNEVRQSLVYIGNELDWILCDVQTSSTNVITCITRPIPDSIPPNVAQDVTVATRIVEESVCVGTCKFTYDESVTPKVTLISPASVQPGDTITLTGTNLDSAPVVTIRGLPCTLVGSPTATSISFIVPANTKPHHNAVITVNVPGKGNALFVGSDGTAEVKVVVNSISRTTGPTAGVLLTINGNGFHGLSTVKVGSYNCPVRSYTTTTITCKATSSGLVAVSDQYFSAITCGVSCMLTLSGSGPAVTSIPNKAVASGAADDFTLTLTGTTLGAGSALLLLKTDSSYNYTCVQTGSPTATQLQVRCQHIPGGDYNIEVLIGTAYATVTASENNIAVPITVNAFSYQSSIAGDRIITITGTGFHQTSNSQSNHINVCGLNCAITAATPTQVTCLSPAFVNPASLGLWPKLAKAQTLDGTWSGDVATEVANVMDGVRSTFYNSPNTACYIKLQLAAGSLAQLSEVQFFPRVNTAASGLAGSIIQGSNDGTTWTNLYTVDASAHDGWNYWTPTSTYRYRYYRFFGGSSSKKCALAEIKFSGILMTDNTATEAALRAAAGVNCDSVVSINTKSVTVPASVNYKYDNTPVVWSLSTRRGTAAGGTPVTFTGANFIAGTSHVSVLIDNVPCTVSAATISSITCTTGPAPDISLRVDSLDSEIVVTFDTVGDAVLNRTTFFYIDNWSARTTWGGIVPPRVGDSVHIPAGQTVLMDISPPYLKAIVVEGALIIDNANINVDCEYIMINNGRFQIGTWNDPITSHVTVTLHGDKLSPSLPYFGNKVIGIRKGIMEMHGKKYLKTWSKLDTTAATGATSIVIQDAVDWEVGGTIVIASTDFDHKNSEERTIISITPNSPSAGKTTIQVDALEHDHYAGTFDCTGDGFEMRAEVGYLSRHVVIRGDSNSEAKQYGVQVMAFSPGDETTIVRISFTEIAYAGQSYDTGRYALHLRQLGNLKKSFLIGNSIHHTYNRAIALNGLYYLPVQWNFAYKVMGHAIFLEDGIESNNVFEDNLVMNVYSSNSLLNTDQTPACFFITHPNNVFRRNHCAGTDRFGFWFNLKVNPDGASATTSICPRGEILGEFLDNAAHSNGRDGLRIYPDLTPRTYPCQAFGDYTKDDPYASNPSIQGSIAGFTSWKNMRSGINAETIGAVLIQHAFTADNLRSNIEVSVGNRSPQKTFGVDYACIVGNSPNAGDLTWYVSNSTRGLVTPRVDWMWATNIKWFNFQQSTMTAIETCSHCELGTSTDSGGRTTFFGGLQFNSVTRRVRFNVPYREILRDTDGTLTGQTAAGGTVTYYYKHLETPECTRNEAVYNGLVCDSTVLLRRVLIYNPVAFWSFYGMDLRVLQMTTGLDVSATTPADYSKITFRDNSNPTYHWVFVAITGRTYKIHWANGINFDSFRFARGDTWLLNDKSVVIVHNHTAYRETYEFYRNAPSGTRTFINNQTVMWTDATVDTLEHGAWYHDVDNSILRFVLNGHQNGTLDVYAYTCKVNCPIPVVTAPPGPGTGPAQTFYWCPLQPTDPIFWPNGYVPKAGEDVSIAPEWTVILNCNTTDLASLVIHGSLIWDDTQEYELVLTSHKVWVQGTLRIGKSLDDRYPGKARIRLTGDRDSDELVMGMYLTVSNKVLAVTGDMFMYGEDIQTTQSQILIQTAAAGTNCIKVADPVQGLWRIGDSVLISGEVTEILTIASFTDSSTVCFVQNLANTHFGGPASSIVNGAHGGSIDRRAVAWCLLRSIIIEGTHDDNWGGRVYVTEIFDPQANIMYRGAVQMDGVLMRFLGQGNTTQAGFTFERITSPGRESVISNSIMMDSEGWNVLLTKVRGVTFNKNLFFKSKQRAVYWELDISDVVFTNNYVLKNIDRGLNLEQVSTDLYDLTVAFMATEAVLSNVQVSNNVFAHCDNACVAFPGGDCLATPAAPWTFQNNFAHHGALGWLATASGSTCIGISHFSAWSVTEGVVSYFIANKVVATNIFLADVNHGFVIATGTADGDHQVIIQQSHVVGLLSLDIANYYADKSAACSNGAAVYIPVATVSAKTVPPLRSALPWRRVRSNHLWQGTLTVHDVTFENFDDSQVAQCQRNTIFRSNEFASDASSMASFSSITRVNVGANNVFYFSNPDPAWINVVDCGNWQCTGLYNIIVKDLDGTLSGTNTAKVMIPDNQGVVDGTCSRSVAMNGHTCNGQGWGMLTFQNMDEDFETRIITPINVTRPSGFRNDLNTYMDHYVDGQVSEEEGDLRRLSRWHSIIQTNHDDYEILYTGNLPNVIKFQLQGASASDYVIIKQRYTRSQVIQVTKADGTVIKPNLPSAGVVAGDNCGSNVYLGVDQIVQFKLTGDPNCVLQTQITNAVKGRVRYTIDIDAFFAQDGPTKFIDNVVMILGIDPTRIRTTNIVAGSTIIEFHVIGSNQDAPSAGTGSAVTSELKSLVNQLNSAVSDGRMSILNSAVLESDFQVSVKADYYEEGEEVVTKKSPMLIIIVAGGISVGVVLIGAYFVYRRYQNMKNKIKPNIQSLKSGYHLAKLQSQEFGTGVSQFNKGSQANLILSSNDLKVEDAEQHIPIKSMIDTPTSNRGESKIRMFAKAKSVKSAIWDTEDIQRKRDNEDI